MPRKHFFDERFFDAIDTQEKAYLLGLLYADGCVDFRGKTGGRVRLSLTDRDLVVQAVALVGLTEAAVKISYRSGGYENGKPTHGFCLCSGHMARALTALGCGPRKSLTCDFPSAEAVPPGLIRHFVRGYFDGDGCVNVTAGKTKRVAVVGTLSFIEELQRLIPGPTAIAGHITCRFVYYLNFGQKSVVTRFRDWMYEDASIFLARKRDIFFTPVTRGKNQRTLKYEARKAQVRAMLLEGASRADIIRTAGVGPLVIMGEMAALKAKGLSVPAGGVRLRADVDARKEAIWRLISEGTSRADVMARAGISFGYYHHLKRAMEARGRHKDAIQTERR